MRELLLARALRGQSTEENIKLVTVESWDARDANDNKMKLGALWLAAYLNSYSSDTFRASFSNAFKLLHNQFALHDPRIEAQNEERLKIKEEILSGKFSGTLIDIYDRIEAAGKV